MRIIDQKIPTHIGLIILMIAGTVIAWITIHIGEKLIQSAPNSEIFNVDLRQETKAVNNK